VGSTAARVEALIGPDGLAGGEAEGRADVDEVVARALEDGVPVTS
jgi:hypothetical protein